MALDFDALGADVTATVMDAAKEFYADGREMAAEDEAFFKEIALDYKEAGVLLAKAKLEGNSELADEMLGTLKQLTGTVRSRVAERALDLDEAAKASLSSVLWGVGKALGTILGGAVLGAL